MRLQAKGKMRPWTPTTASTSSTALKTGENYCVTCTWAPWKLMVVSTTRLNIISKVRSSPSANSDQHLRPTVALSGHETPFWPVTWSFSPSAWLKGTRSQRVCSSTKTTRPGRNLSAERHFLHGFVPTMSSEKFLFCRGALSSLSARLLSKCQSKTIC